MLSCMEVIKIGREGGENFQFFHVGHIFVGGGEGVGKFNVSQIRLFVNFFKL